ncbi:hypothetical protein JANAI62_27310 [Jannaschia pagri]|uniref:Haemolytic domain-containing protein n=1 Tax=Jannaschia pagri TaxID=2829797 RepID=A0ABQ4NNZ7_9RHOB|nr:hypothetical protein JANAI61_27320 [Jannaschia sp. AI_61]GIT96108.1 hypothetical protein JANAI62_27310 [Jannaschia sp. AI_62]
MLSRTALAGIHLYQRFLSPRKGYRCAHSVVHGGTGCSGYAKFAIRDHGFWQAVPLIRARFRDCAQAYETIKQQDEPQRSGKARRRAEKTCDTACCGNEACASGLPSALCRGGSAAGPSKTCDANPCDGDIGCGGCDVCSCG